MGGGAIVGPGEGGIGFKSGARALKLSGAPAKTRADLFVYRKWRGAETHHCSWVWIFGCNINIKSMTEKRNNELQVSGVPGQLSSIPLYVCPPSLP